MYRVKSRNPCHFVSNVQNVWGLDGICLPVSLPCSACPVLPDPFWLSWSGCPVMVVQFWLSCSGCPVLAVLFWLSCSECPAPAVTSLLHFYIHRHTVGVRKHKRKNKERESAKAKERNLRSKNKSARGFCQAAQKRMWEDPKNVYNFKKYDLYKQRNSVHGPLPSVHF